MDFDFGDVLTRAWKITWKHKVLWVISVLPFLTMFLILPFWLILLFQQNLDFNAILTWMENPIYRTIAILLYLIVIVSSMFLQIASRSSLDTRDLYRRSRASACELCPPAPERVSLFLADFGQLPIDRPGDDGRLPCLLCHPGGAVCGDDGICNAMHPAVIFFMIPLFLLVMTLLEQSESAIVADELKVMDALKRADELIKANIWKYVLITLIVYFGTNILISIVTFPLMIPMFFFYDARYAGGTGFQSMIRMQAVFGVVILPLMALLQGFSLTYIKSAMMLTYLRLTRPELSSPLLPGIVEAPA